MWMCRGSMHLRSVGGEWVSGHWRGPKRTCCLTAWVAEGGHGYAGRDRWWLVRRLPHVSDRPGGRTVCHAVRDVVEGGNAVAGLPCIREMRGGTSMAAHAEAAPGCIGGGGSSANTPNTAANAAAKVALMCRIVCGRRGAISGHDLN